MELKKYLVKEEIAVNTYEQAAELVKILLDNDYCAMISREEQLWIVNWIWSPNADRNGVIFLSREIYEMDVIHYYQNQEKGIDNNNYDYL